MAATYSLLCFRTIILAFRQRVLIAAGRMSCSTRIVGTKCASGAVVGRSSRPFHTEAGTYHVSDSLTLPTSGDFEDVRNIFR
jgi:hypothetical protein